MTEADLPGSSLRLTGGCQCGAVRYALSAQPAEPGVCHCRMCQKAGGAPFMAFAGVATSDVTWTKGTAATFRSSTIATRGFCANCGTPLTYQARPDRISFTVGSFDDAAAVVPVEQLCRESLLPWADHVAALKVVPDPQTQPGFASYQHPDHET